MERIWDFEQIAYGGDYNPEQWPEEIWHEDMRMFKLAHINTVTLNVFSWASIQPSENEYDFERLDKIINLATDNGLKIVLATATGAHPAWMAHRYPEVLRTDFQGRAHKFGGRHNSCPNSKVYRTYAGRIAGKLAERYGKYKNIIGWHVSNEFGGECYCENCAKAFREWLKEKYGTIEEVNKAWDTAFWGHTFYDFDEIVLPNELSEHFQLWGKDMTQFQSITLDYRKFNSQSIMDCFKLEYDEIRKYSDIPITTNLMSFFPPLDYQKWGKYMDFISWDNYPGPTDPPADIALNHELMKGCKDGKSFCLMEQTPSVQNWQPYNKLKRPGDLRKQSFQAIAHGSDTVMYFQMRRSIGACEKYHGAVIDHVGHENTRVFREVSEIGAELEKMGNSILGARTNAKVALLFDWENWWAINGSSGPSIIINYHHELKMYYRALHKKNIPADIISVDTDLSKYDVVVAPILYMVKDGYDEKIREYVKNGGTFVTTYFSGYVGETDLVYGGYPGKLSDILGIWVEESDALPEGECNHFDFEGKTYAAKILLDIVRPKEAKSLSTYNEDFYAGETLITANDFGSGKAYYVGASSDEDFYDAFVEKVTKEKGIEGLCDSPAGVEVTIRENENGKFYFVINHNNEEVSVTLPFAGVDILSDKEVGGCVTLVPKDVKVINVK